MLWSMTAHLLSSPASMLAVATAVAAVLILAILADRLRTPRRVPQPVRVLSQRERARRAAAIRLNDPDAAGRPRPRAPDDWA
jgi:hypothetical protein